LSAIQSIGVWISVPIFFTVCQNDRLRFGISRIMAKQSRDLWFGASGLPIGYLFSYSVSLHLPLFVVTLVAVSVVSFLDKKKGIFFFTHSPFILVLSINQSTCQIKPNHTHTFPFWFQFLFIISHIYCNLHYTISIFLVLRIYIPTITTYRPESKVLKENIKE
jgi:prepilin signal peptidase PulO-like enzyme (type II secretory pathway)